MLPPMPTVDPLQRFHSVLVLGGSGAVGRHLLRRLALAGQPAEVLSRQPPPAWARQWTGLSWRRGALGSIALPPAPVLLLSAGPLDALANWLPGAGMLAGSRLVALSSMSARWKLDSPNPAERALAARLLDSEAALAAHCASAAVELVLLRPTLIYGAGIDRSLSPLLRLARRWRVLPWPRAGRGLRQPVHADDVAAALLAGARLAIPPAQPLALPGGSRLPYDAVLDRLLDALAPGCRRLPLPLPMPRALLRRLAARNDRLGLHAAKLWRARLDQLAAPGWDVLGLAPRAFMPDKADFEPWEQATVESASR